MHHTHLYLYTFSYLLGVCGALTLATACRPTPTPQSYVQPNGSERGEVLSARTVELLLLLGALSLLLTLSFLTGLSGLSGLSGLPGLPRIALLAGAHRAASPVWAVVSAVVAAVPAVVPTWATSVTSSATSSATSATSAFGPQLCESHADLLFVEFLVNVNASLLGVLPVDLVALDRIQALLGLLVECGQVLLQLLELLALDPAVVLEQTRLVGQDLNFPLEPQSVTELL